MDDAPNLESTTRSFEATPIPRDPVSTTPISSATKRSHPPTMLRPPVNRAMRVLDRSFFKKTVPLASATVMETRNIARVKDQLLKTQDLLDAPRLKQVYPVQVLKKGDEKQDQRRKCLLLRQEIMPDDASTWSPTIHELVEAKSVEIRPYRLHLDYDYWTYHDIISAILPEEDLTDTPAGFTQVGHIAHLNLRDQYLQYRYLIGEILVDKNPTISTVINKVEDVGSSSEFRVFPYELLAGKDGMNVTVSEQDCQFSFDYSKVYWNSRLSTEHGRLVDRFQGGEAVCDVMAGVGPFAIPAGKKGIFVWANDLNPHGYEMMLKNIKKNKVGEFVQAFNRDGRDFIKWATKKLYSEPQVAVVPQKSPKKNDNQQPGRPKLHRHPPVLRYTSPPTFDHYVMNLPASAISFLDAFIGVYAGEEHLFLNRKLPLIHVYCFSTKPGADDTQERNDICQRISEKIGYTITPEDCETGSGDKERELEIRDVRLVSPNKMMFCATFRLPREVAFKTV